jgi:hypothetical protein
MVSVPRLSSRARFATIAVAAMALAGLLVGAVAISQLGWRATSTGAFATLDGAHIYGPHAQAWGKTIGLRLASPSLDARFALATGDHRLLGLAGFGPYIPGTESRETSAYMDRFGVRFLASGCVIESTEEEQYRRVAAEYALEYNKVILAQPRTAPRP